jgi:hypothetical protein
MTQNRERLTWVILILCFLAFCSLTVALPFGARATVQRSTRALIVQASTEDTVIELFTQELINSSGVPQRFRTPTGMQTGFGDRGVYEVINSDTDDNLARIEVSDNTRMRVNRATMPRFGRSTAKPYLRITLERGRIRLSIPEKVEDALPIVTHVDVGGTRATIVTPGSYAIEASDGQMQLSVLEGNAAMQGKGEELFISQGERGIVNGAGEIVGLFDADRELIRNGSFEQGLAFWNPTAWTTEQPPSGKTEVFNAQGEAVLHFERFGIGNARTDVIQPIDQGVADFAELELSITMRVLSQTLPVCGGIGTECPMTVRIEFTDASGQGQAWEQGFYAVGTVNPQGAPDTCQGTCGFPLNRYQHKSVPQLGETYVYQSPNLISVLSGLQIRPNFLQRIILTAEGHSFAVEVISVSLVAREMVR